MSFYTDIKSCSVCNETVLMVLQSSLTTANTYIHIQA